MQNIWIAIRPGDHSGIRMAKPCSRRHNVRVNGASSPHENSRTHCRINTGWVEECSRDRTRVAGSAGNCPPPLFLFLLLFCVRLRACLPVVSSLSRPTLYPKALLVSEPSPNQPRTSNTNLSAPSRTRNSATRLRSSPHSFKPHNIT